VRVIRHRNVEELKTPPHFSVLVYALQNQVRVISC
jgi:hypothetical protein